jgi:Uma2 family endonuclease
MMVLQTRVITVEEFEQFIRLPENADRNFEYIGGEIVEVVSNPLSSKLAVSMSTFIGMYLLNNDIGHLTGADGGYIVSGERYIPDVGFISYNRQPQLEYQDGYIQNAPDLAVEVPSPSNEEDVMAIKIANYLAAGTVVWLLKPPEKQIAVFVPGQPVKIFHFDDTLDGGDVLPGFTVKLADIFRSPTP